MVTYTSKALIVAAFVALGGARALAAPADVATPTPLPAPATNTTMTIAPLREIGHVRAATAFCQAVYDHGGLATSIALNNDASLARTSQYLGHIDLDDNAFNKPKAVWDMQRSYEALMSHAKDAIGESNALRKLADDAPTPEQKAALVAYADAIGGALHRQQLVGGVYRRFAAYLEAHEAVSWQQQDRELVTATVIPVRPGDSNLHQPTSWQRDTWGTTPTNFYPAMPGEFNYSQDPRDHVTPRLTDQAKSEATHLTEMHDAVVNDELHAAANVDAAFGPCARSTMP